MTPNQYLWTQAQDRLVAAVTGIGFSAELAELMAKQLGSPKAIDRMVSYIRQARPRTEEQWARYRAENDSRFDCVRDFKLFCDESESCR